MKIFQKIIEFFNPINENENKYNELLLKIEKSGEKFLANLFIGLNFKEKNVELEECEYCKTKLKKKGFNIYGRYNY